ncbi:MAG: hypothetical protein AAF801_07505 [Pseudomonadota bacterium]
MPDHLLITGTSHTGKSTLAARIGTALGWPVTSTDRMARHPGRPWENAPEHVLEFYQKMSAHSVHTFLKHHHQNMRPIIARFVAEMRDQQRPFVLEGAALRPEYIAELDGTAICLHANEAFLADRIRRSALYDNQTPALKQATDAFIARSLGENALFLAASQAHAIPIIDVMDDDAITEFANEFLKRAEI